MTNTFGQSKANEDNTWKNNKEMNPPENSSVKNDCAEFKDKPEDQTWRPTDSPLESPTDSEFDDSEAKKREKNIETDSPGLNPDIAE